MTEWSTVVIATLTGVLGLVGGLAGQELRARHERQAVTEVDRKQQRNERREAMVAVLAAATAIESQTGGAIVTDTLRDASNESKREFTHARARLRIMAPRAVFDTVDAYLLAVTMRSNALSQSASRSSRDAARSEAQARGYDSDEKVDELLDAAVRAGARWIEGAS